MTLMDAIKRAHAAKMRGGPDGPTGLVLAACLPSCEELADRFRVHDPTLTEAEALEEGAATREAALEVLESIMAGEAGEIEEDA